MSTESPDKAWKRVLTSSFGAAQTGWTLRLRAAGRLSFWSTLHLLLFLWKQGLKAEI